MCGIVGVIGSHQAIDLTLEGLERLEYRGYDSAGICSIKNNQFNIIKEKGKIKNLKNSINNNKIYANVAIGHTRWATHGIPNQINAHPHNSNNFLSFKQFSNCFFVIILCFCCIFNAYIIDGSSLSHTSSTRPKDPTPNILTPGKDKTEKKC